MASIKMQREALLSALKNATVSTEEAQAIEDKVGSGARTVNVTLTVDELPVGYLAALLDRAELNANQRAMISMRVHGMSGDRAEFARIYNTPVSNPVEFASTFSALGLRSHNCELFLNGRWYPISLGAECHEDELKVFQTVWLSGTASIGEFQESLRYRVASQLFLTEEGRRREPTVGEVLRDLGLRPLQTSAVDYNLKLLRSERESRKTGEPRWVAGPVLIKNHYAWWTRTESRSLGTPESPRKAVIEAELETEEDERHYYGAAPVQHVSRLPLVRLFSLDTKRYVYADVEDLRDYEFDAGAIGRLHLPERMLGILNKVFRTPTAALFGDLIAGKHGGMVILASGNPGVGKTLTAEVYAEMTERPLYVLELGELGTAANEVEENLNRVFTRVARWNAVLQFDECEIFLAHRGEDLERSAIVGIFLRLLDYYRGILFLTTNRPDVLDHAVISRVTLRLEYPDLDDEARASIWRTMFDLAELRLTEGDFADLGRIPLNGRQIRNLTRLAKILYSDGELTAQNVIDLA